RSKRDWSSDVCSSDLDNPPHPLTRRERDRALLERRRVILTKHRYDFPPACGRVSATVGLLPIHPALSAFRVVADPDVHHRPQQLRALLFLLAVAHLLAPPSISCER